MTSRERAEKRAREKKYEKLAHDIFHEWAAEPGYEPITEDMAISLLVRMRRAIAAALDEAYREGAEQMRERAAKECESWWDLFNFESFAPTDQRRHANPNHIGARIRALPLDAPGEGER